MLAAVTLFKAKSIVHLLHGAQLDSSSNFALLELVQSKFLVAVLQASCCASNTVAGLEMGLMQTEG